MYVFVGCSNISHKNNFRKKVVFKKHLNVAKLFECGFLSSLKHLNIFLAGIGGACVTFRIRFRLWEMTFSFFPFLIYPMQKSSRFCLLINFSCFSKEQARSPPKKKEKTVPTAKTLYLPGKKEGNSHFNSFLGGELGREIEVSSLLLFPSSFLPPNPYGTQRGLTHTCTRHLLPHFFTLAARS